MISSDKRYTLIFNGEIYNYIEIRAQLEKYGIRFKSKCDTEVLLKAWELMGTSCLDQFDGMFVFALFDRKNKN